MPEGKGLRCNVAHYGDAEFAAYLRKAFIKAMGYTDEALERPVPRAVEIAREGLKPSDIMTVPAFENAFRTVMAAGGSTNAIIHLTAMAGRLGI